MFLLRHIAIVCKGDIGILMEFYKSLFNPIKIIISEESGAQVEEITGIKGISIITCKMTTKDLVLELISYKNPTAKIFIHESPAFSGFNHIAFTVDDFQEAKKILKKSGGTILSEGITSYNDKIKNAAYTLDPEGNILEIVEERINNNKI